ncbi:hypothetical protein GCM10027300_27920 [Modestobacter lapidis]
MLASAAVVGLTGCTGGAADVERAAAGQAAGTVTGATTSTSTTAPVTPPVGVVTDDDAPVATDAPRPATTDVVLTYLVWDGAADAVIASGYVSPVIEDGGTCTLELTRDGESVSTTSDAVADASTTSCGQLQVLGDDLAPGEWSAVLGYESGTTSGTSEPFDVRVAE